jgi:uncharacterized DUF497 family protein
LRFTFDPAKSRRLRAKRGIGFEEAQDIFFGHHTVDPVSDEPEQSRAIGWVNGKLYSLIYEVREDQEGDIHHLVTLWRSTKAEERIYEEAGYKEDQDHC